MAFKIKVENENAFIDDPFINCQKTITVLWLQSRPPNVRQRQQTEGERGVHYGKGCISNTAEN